MVILNNIHILVGSIETYTRGHHSVFQADQRGKQGKRRVHFDEYQKMDILFNHYCNSIAIIKYCILAGIISTRTKNAASKEQMILLVPLFALN